MKSEYSKIADELQEKLKYFLKPLGFKTKGRTFNRVTEDGLVQVINLQMGGSDPPNTVYVSGLTQNLYGFFTINLGVYVPEVSLYHGGGLAKNFIQDYHCCVRNRLGEIGSEEKVGWWKLNNDDDLIHHIIARIERDAIPFLERFSTRDKILKEWHNLSENITPPRIVCAIIYSEKGNKESAKKLLVEQSKETRNHNHSKYVKSLATKLGIEIN